VMVMRPTCYLDLKALFFEAFAPRPRPPADHVVRPAVSRHDADRLRTTLAAKTSAELSAHDIRAAVEGNLWMLTPEAFHYFLPALLYASLESYASISVFVSELVGALTAPSRPDVVEALDRAARVPRRAGLPADTAKALRKQQLEWFDSGAPTAVFHERVDGLTPAEGAAVLAFFVAMQQAHGADFPFGELQAAVDRRWARYRTS
jgi:hypothetical protein